MNELQDAYEWLENVTVKDDVPNNFNWLIVTLLKDMDRRLSEHEERIEAIETHLVLPL